MVYSVKKQKRITKSRRDQYITKNAKACSITYKLFVDIKQNFYSITLNYKV